MDKSEIIKSLGKKSNGEIYLGVVGAVRTGKSTFIKKCIETLILPYMDDDIEKKRCMDEIPQTAQGKTIMTVEPKFVPSNGATINIEGLTTNIKLVDCVGYVTPESVGYEDELGNPRMVKTPWFPDEIPFVEAASIGTEKVIRDHATIGIVISTDGSILGLPRSNYVDAEDKVITELKGINKPFIVIMNSTHPGSPETKTLANALSQKHNVPVIPISVEDMNINDITNVLKEALYEFPVSHIEFKIPDWVGVLKNTHPLKQEFINKMKQIQKDNKHDEYDINSKRAEWKDILAVYTVKISNGKNDAEVMTLDNNKISILKEIFWEMNEITSSTEEVTDKDNKKKIVLHINVNGKDALEMAQKYNFSIEQNKQLAELLDKQYASLWSSVIYGSSVGNTDIVEVAKKQIGNIGGQPFWSWYGYNSRVEWCACFVSWCANECGYIEAGIIPKFASCESEGVAWFKTCGLWQEKGYTPKSGDIIFFDWADSNDGLADHVGIVSRVENGIIYTVEGNTRGDVCKENKYSIDSSVIRGFGTPAYK